MTMIRQGDRVRWPNDGVILHVVSMDRATGIALLNIGSRVPDDELMLICAHEGRVRTCERAATCFERESGRPICEQHAVAYEPADIVDVRPDPSQRCPCACGEDLAAGKPREPWTLGAIVCEYRDCLHCGSTRAFMHRDEIKGREVAIYADPDTSEVTHSAKTILDCVDVDPPNARAVMMRNGVVVARAVVAVDGDLYWHLLAPS